MGKSWIGSRVIIAIVNVKKQFWSEIVRYYSAVWDGSLNN
jgi:hypothetical protein